MSTRSATLNLAVVGATGAVGREVLALLDEHRLPQVNVKLLASARSAGQQLSARGDSIDVELLTEDSFKNIDMAIFSAGGGVSRAYAHAAVDAGCIVIDNSSAFRMDPDVPLVVPEVNRDAMSHMSIGNGGIIANPNCSTIIMLMAVTPIHRAVGVERMVVSTYQAASGAGAAAMAELEQQTRELLDGKSADDLTQDIFGRQYAFNLFSHNSPLQPSGYNQEEEKMLHETRKIWNAPDARITATCIRVPVMRAHAESINLTLRDSLDADDARKLIEQFPGTRIVDDRELEKFPEPIDASSVDEVLVGRIRQDPSQDSNTGLDLFVCGDQLRKGAALNAVQIAEVLVGSH